MEARGLELVPLGTTPLGRGLQYGPEDFRGTLLKRRAGDPPSGKSPQGLWSEAPESLPGAGTQASALHQDPNPGCGEGVSLTEWRGVSELSTEEIKTKLRSGANDERRSNDQRVS